jgi:prevent-host-death family protein
MKINETIKPVSFLKANASRLVDEIAENHSTVVISHKGTAKVVVQDLETYQKDQESLALLKMLAQSSKSKSEGNYLPVDEAFEEIRSRLK